MRLHGSAVFVFREIGSAVLAWHRNEFAGRATDTDCENLHAIFRSRLRRADGFAAKIFAVGDENENFVRRSARLENCFCFVNGRGDICPAFRNDIDIKRVKRFAKARRNRA